MSAPITVIALDAADYRLLKEWGCENVLLENHGALETYVYGASVPATVEVWPTIATGLSPEEHGIIAEQNAQNWEHPLLRLASSVTKYLPREARDFLGKPFHKNGSKKRIAQTDASHVFEDGYVFGWPGITDAEHLVDAWNLMFRTDQNALTSPEFEGHLFRNTGAEFGWAARMADEHVPIVGVHSHILDIAGHAYANREDKLRNVYEKVDSMLGFLRSQTDTLVVLSDHGMQTGWIDEDTSPGTHSRRAMISTTEEGALPKSVYDVCDWLEQKKRGGEQSADIVESDAPTEHLRDLGYF